MRACIFGAGDYCGEGRSLVDGSFVIAADGGFLHCRAQGIVPSLAIGDFDSLGFLPDGLPIIRHPVEKDDTDMALAAREAVSRGCREILFFGALGGRLDHTLANITLLRALAKEKISAYLFGEREVITVLLEGETAVFAGKPSGIFSLFSLSEEAVVSIDGGKYPLKKGRLTSDCALGVSNEFLQKEAKIEVHAGEVLLVWERKDDTLPMRARA